MTVPDLVTNTRHPIVPNSHACSPNSPPSEYIPPPRPLLVSLLSLLSSHTCDSIVAAPYLAISRSHSLSCACAGAHVHSPPIMPAFASCSCVSRPAPPSLRCTYSRSRSTVFDDLPVIALALSSFSRTSSHALPRTLARAERV